MRILGVFIGACFLVVATSVVVAADAKPPIVVIAHRGAHEGPPENTLAAFLKGAELGCDYVEMDVRRTKDGKYVLMHDSGVDRMTDGHGKVDQLTLDEIRKLRVKARDKNDKTDYRVPTFDEALTACKGKIKIYVDHKTGPPAEVFAYIKEHGMVDQVVIYSSVESLREFKKLAPSVWIMPDHPGSVEKIAKLAADLKPETLDGNLANWKREQVDAAHKAGVQVWVDNLGSNDNPKGFQKALDWGIEGIQTDHPALLIDFLKKAGRK